MTEQMTEVVIACNQHLASLVIRRIDVYLILVT